jgi:hypothetical protein
MFNPLTILGTKLLAPVVFRFIGAATSSLLLRTTIGTLVPFLVRLPVRSLLQIALGLPIRSLGGQTTTVLSIGGIRSLLGVIPGVTTELINSHQSGFISLIRLIVWVWLLVSTTSIFSVLSFIGPLTVTFLGFMGANYGSLLPMITPLIKGLSAILPNFSWDLFYYCRDAIIAVLSFSGQKTIDAAPTIITWTSVWIGLVSVSEVIIYWITPHMDINSFREIVTAIGNLCVPYIPSVLQIPLGSLFSGLLLIIMSPFLWVMGTLPWLHSWLGSIPYHNEIWNGLLVIGNYTLAYIPFDGIIAAIRIYLGL